jgi:hypothetical protein
MVAMALFAVAAPSGVTVPASAATEPDTIVSLTFDDGWNTQLQAARYLADQGMQGTCYVNSEQIGDDSSLSLDDLRASRAPDAASPPSREAICRSPRTQLVELRHGAGLKSRVR